MVGRARDPYILCFFLLTHSRQGRRKHRRGCEVPPVAWGGRNRVVAGRDLSLRLGTEDSALSRGRQGNLASFSSPDKLNGLVETGERRGEQAPTPGAKREAEARSLLKRTGNTTSRRPRSERKKERRQPQDRNAPTPCTPRSRSAGPVIDQGRRSRAVPKSIYEQYSRAPFSSGTSKPKGINQTIGSLRHSG